MEWEHEQKRRYDKGKENKRAQLENTCIMYVQVLMFNIHGSVYVGVKVI